MFELMSKVKVDASDKETQQYEFDKKMDGQFESFTTSSTRATNDMKSAAESI
jgi:hypothetical protein